MLPPPPWTEFPHLCYGGEGEHTLVVCGYLRGDAVLFDPVLRALPSLFVVRPPPGPAADWVRASVEYALMASQPHHGAARIDQRLPELLFTEVLRLYLAECGDAELTGWLAALRDPVVGPAVSLLHADPARDWTVAELAVAVAASKTVLVERFRQLLGRSPIRYLAEWRLNLAPGCSAPPDSVSATSPPRSAIAPRMPSAAPSNAPSARHRRTGEPTEHDRCLGVESDRKCRFRHPNGDHTYQ